MAKKFCYSEASRHFGLDFASYDENNKLVSDGNRGHVYINSTYTDNYSAFGAPKYYIKVQKDGKNFNEYIVNYCKHVHLNLNENELQEKIAALKNEVLQSATETSVTRFKHAAIKVADNEQINIVKSKDDSIYYIVSELARKKLMDGDTLPKYHDVMRIVIDKYKDF